MLSRVAESIYWMGRYIERAESVARFVSVNLHVILDAPDNVAKHWPALIYTTGDQELFASKYGAFSQANVIRFLTFDRDYPHSIISCLRAARENARSIREVISSEMWEQVNKFYLSVNSAADTPPDPEDLMEFFNSVRSESQLFLGATDSTMTHNEAWHFCRLGRKLERADKTSRILDVKSYVLLQTGPREVKFDDVHWTALLRSVGAFEMYRKRHGKLHPNRVIEFLLLNPQFPRSVKFCIDTALDSLRHVSGEPPIARASTPMTLLNSLLQDLGRTTAEEIVTSSLHKLIDNLQSQLNAAGSGIHDAFFAKRSPDQTQNQAAFQTHDAA